MGVCQLDRISHSYNWFSNDHFQNLTDDDVDPSLWSLTERIYGTPAF